MKNAISNFPRDRMSIDTQSRLDVFVVQCTLNYCVRPMLHVVAVA
jgi:hypothetical protein